MDKQYHRQTDNNGELPPPEKPKRQPILLRCIALVAVFALAAAGLSLRLSRLQVDEASEWEARASRQQLASIPLPAQRGNIYDRNMKLLAQSATVWTVEASPDVLVQSNVKNNAEREAAKLASRELAAILGLDEAELYENLSNKEKKYYRIQAKIEKPLADAVREMCRNYNIGGIYLVEDTKRYYPYEGLAATVLGFVGSDNDGLEGLERQYEEILAGTAGRTMSMIDARGNEIPTAGEGVTYPAEDGHSIVLTLDADIQRSVEKHLEAAVTTHNARQRGFAIVMDVNTGAILALAVYPSYDPNSPYDILDAAALAGLEEYIPGSEEYIQQQGLARTLQWRNKALADTYEPGSVLKIITAAAALDSGIYTQASQFTCGASIMVEGWNEPMRCAGDPPTNHGAPTLRTALIESCNVSFIRMAQGMGSHTWYSYLKAFGLTEPTGVDLPGEPSQSAINNLVYSEEQLGPVQLASCSFGQSNKYTAVQMIAAVSAAVNGGNLMQPYIVAEEIDAYGNVLKSYEPVTKRQVISPQTSAQIRDILEELVSDTPNGRNAYATGFRVGGKSGTSQKLDVMLQEDRNDAFVSSFLGFAPADDPQIAVLVALDEPEDTRMGNYFGGRLVGPTVREIIKDALPILGVDPVYVSDEDLAQTTISTPRCTDQDVMAAGTVLENKGLTYRVVGSGATVIGQSPAAYMPIPHGGEVVLYTDASTPQEQVTVPDVSGQTAKNAIQYLRSIGLNVLTQGAPGEGSGIVVVAQDLEAETVVPRGTMITLTMEDTTHVNE